MNNVHAVILAGCTLFSHKSRISGEAFVARKISPRFARIKLGLQACLLPGVLNTLHNWGLVLEQLELQWLMLKQDKPEVFGIAINTQFGVHNFVNAITKESSM